MTETFDSMERAAALRAKGMHAVTAGQVEEARAAFLQSLKHDPNSAAAFLWLAGLASKERDAYRFLDKARQLDPDHPQLIQAAEGIHRHFALVRPSVSSRESAVSMALQDSPVQVAQTQGFKAAGRLTSVAALAVPVAFRLVSIALLMLALIFVVTLLMEMGRGGAPGTFPTAVSTSLEYAAGYLKGVTQGSLGEIASSFGSNRGTPVVEELARALPKSLGLLAVSMVIAVLAGLYLGLAAAVKRHSRLSGILLFGSALGVSTPSFFAAMLLIWFSVWLYQNTGEHILPVAGFGWDGHLLLPALVLAARPAAAVTRLSYNALVEILNAEYVRTARGKGLRQSVVLQRHVLRNAGVPILTTIVVSLRFSLAVLPIVEYIFNWPGIGLVLLKGIQAQDVPAVLGMILPLALLFALVNLVAELLYMRIDPRLRDSKVGVV